MDQDPFAAPVWSHTGGGKAHRAGRFNFLLEANKELKWFRVAKRVGQKPNHKLIPGRQ
jgi:hypothetical protein